MIIEASFHVTVRFSVDYRNNTLQQVTTPTAYANFFAGARPGQPDTMSQADFFDCQFSPLLRRRPFRCADFHAGQRQPPLHDNIRQIDTHKIADTDTVSLFSSPGQPPAFISGADSAFSAVFASWATPPTAEIYTKGHRQWVGPLLRQAWVLQSHRNFQMSDSRTPATLQGWAAFMLSPEWPLISILHNGRVISQDNGLYTASYWRIAGNV